MPHVEALCFPQTGYGLAAKGVYLGALMYGSPRPAVMLNDDVGLGLLNYKKHIRMN